MLAAVFLLPFFLSPRPHVPRAYVLEGRDDARPRPSSTSAPSRRPGARFRHRARAGRRRAPTGRSWRPCAFPALALLSPSSRSEPVLGLAVGFRLGVAWLLFRRETGPDAAEPPDGRGQGRLPLRRVRRGPRRRARTSSSRTRTASELRRMNTVFKTLVRTRGRSSRSGRRFFSRSSSRPGAPRARPRPLLVRRRSRRALAHPLSAIAVRLPAGRAATLDGLAWMTREAPGDRARRRLASARTPRPAPSSRRRRATRTATTAASAPPRAGRPFSAGRTTRASGGEAAPSPRSGAADTISGRSTRPRIPSRFSRFCTRTEDRLRRRRAARDNGLRPERLPDARRTSAAPSTRAEPRSSSRMSVPRDPALRLSAIEKQAWIALLVARGPPPARRARTHAFHHDESIHAWAAHRLRRGRHVQVRPRLPRAGPVLRGRDRVQGRLRRREGRGRRFRAPRGEDAGRAGTSRRASRPRSAASPSSALALLLRRRFGAATARSSPARSRRSRRTFSTTPASAATTSGAFSGRPACSCGWIQYLQRERLRDLASRRSFCVRRLRVEGELLRPPRARWSPRSGSPGWSPAAVSTCGTACAVSSTGSRRTPSPLAGALLLFFYVSERPLHGVSDPSRVGQSRFRGDQLLVGPAQDGARRRAEDVLPAASPAVRVRDHPPGACADRLALVRASRVPSGSSPDGASLPS